VTEKLEPKRTSSVWRWLLALMFLIAAVDICLTVLIVRERMVECAPSLAFSYAITTIGIVALWDKTHPQ
jgi:hypothetical protein